MKIYRLKYKIFYIIFALSLSSVHSFANVKEIDPFEKINRPIFEFNNILDKLLLLPISLVYRDFVPQTFKVPFEGLLEQSKYPISTINHAFQGNWELSAHSVKKIWINFVLTLGTGDVKLDEEIEKDYRYTNFNATLNSIDVSSGPYIVLPFVGGNSARGSVAGIVDNFIFVRKKNVTYAKTVIARSQNIETIESLETTSLDYYSTVRNIIMQMDTTSGKNEPVNSTVNNLDFSDDEDLE